eukprot:8140185-Pyramimonas_sp.AAC.1
MSAESIKILERVSEAVPKIQGALTLKQFLPYLVQLSIADFTSQESRHSVLDHLHGFLRETNVDDEIPTEIGDRSIEIMGLLFEKVLDQPSGYASDECTNFLPVFGKLISTLSCSQKRDLWNKEVERMRTISGINSDVVKYTAMGEGRLDSPDGTRLLDTLTSSCNKLEGPCSSNVLPA